VLPLLCHVQKIQFLAEVKATTTGKLLDGLPRNDAVTELRSGKFRYDQIAHHLSSPAHCIDSRALTSLAAEMVCNLIISKKQLSGFL
jgi:hypothetical protein